MSFPKLEEQILKKWKREKTFEKSVERRKNSPRFVFYEGPPTANGRPGIHHVLSRSFKDIVLRYKTMRGFFVPRRAGWDTHGLPVELEVEKRLGLKSKKEIEKYGIARFNEECRKSVWKYQKEWEDLTERMGFWLDMANPYITYQTPYIETLWHIISLWFKKGLLYKDYKVVPYCSRCGTALSSHELAQGYKTVKDKSVYAKFQVKKAKIKLPPKTYFLAWTTTPWTLPGNVALAVDPKVSYILAKKNNDHYICAKDLASRVLGEYQEVKSFQGKSLVGTSYTPLFRFKVPEKGKKIWEVVPASFVSTEEGTGIVHTAVAYGAEDFELGKKENLAMLHLVNEQGKFVKEAKHFQGLFVKDADPLIIQDLKKRSLLFKEEMIEHEYPFCWRCSTPLLYYAKESWFVNMQKVKKQLVANNKRINWVPSHLKEGRMGEWLKEVKDWAFSRERYWGTPLPIWECDECEEKEVIGSVKELLSKKLLQNPYKGKKDINLHRPYVDKVEFPCTKCLSAQAGKKGIMRRVPDVVDVWYDSGAMPFAQNHWQGQKKPTEFPADYIVEAIDQTRGWFYTLLAVSTLLEYGPSYKNVISTGHVLDEKGEKMSKSKGNVVDPFEMMERYGIDAIRWYFYTLNHPWDPKLFTQRDLQLTLRKFILTLWNSHIFYETYRPTSNMGIPTFDVGSNVLDKWIVSRLQGTTGEMTKELDSYDITGAARLLESFVIDDLSLWYIRRSRSRFQNPKSKQDFQQAMVTLGYVLKQTVILAAPFTPFVSETLQERRQKGAGSVHWEDWPRVQKKLFQKELEKQMKMVRNLASKGLALRAKAGLRVRQPLAKLTLKEKLGKELLLLLQEELNVKKIVIDPKVKHEVELDTKLTPALKEEGMVRELLRHIQGMRKDAGYKPRHRIRLRYTGNVAIKNLFPRNEAAIKKAGGITELLEGDRPKQVFDVEKNVAIEGKELWLGIRKL